MDSPCIKQTVCKVLKIFQCGKYLVAYVLNDFKKEFVNRIREKKKDSQKGNKFFGVGPVSGG